MYGVGFGYGSAGATTILKSGGAAYDADAQSFFAASGVTDLTQKNAVNQLVLDLKTNSLWSKMKALYPIVGGNATAHSYNLINTAQYQLSFSSGWTHSSTGMLPNGSSSYADTLLTPSTTLSLNDNHISYYSRTQTTSSGVDIGVSNNLNSNMLDIEINFAGRYYENNQNSYSSPFSATFTTGLFVNSRVASGSFKGYRNGTSEGTISITSTGLANLPIFLGARNNYSTPSFYTSKECAFASIGNGLSDTDTANLYTCIQTFQTSLSRNV
jgi:hypothetical protein